MASSSSTGRPRIIELTEHNYADWMAQVYSWVRGKIGLDHIEPPASMVWPPVFTVDQAADKQAWYLKEEEIASHILQTLTPQQKQHVGLRDTAAIIWHKLEAVHRRKNFSNYYIDCKKLQNLKYVDGTSMQTHLNAHAELRKRISAAGFYQTDAHYCGVFLSSLPPSWDSVVQMQTSSKSGMTLPPLRAKHPNCHRCEDTEVRGLPDNFGCVTGIDWASVSEAVLNEEGRRNERTPISDDKGTALLTGHAAAPRDYAAAVAQSYGGDRNNRRSYSSSGVTCAYCGKKNHEPAQCFSLNGYPPSHKLHDPRFIKPAWQPPTGRANTASSEAASTLPAQGDCGWTATIVSEHHDELVNTNVALHASSAVDGTHQWTLDTGASISATTARCSRHSLRRTDR